jgi:hypothetical protein
MHPNESGSSDPLKNNKILIILMIILVPLLIFSCYIVSICFLISGGGTIESAIFTFDSENEIDEDLLDELYYGLDAGSQENVTNGTYFLVLTIPDLNYSIQFNYLFNFLQDGNVSLRIVDPEPLLEITEFNGMTNDFQIEFRINSTDPDLRGITIFPPNNIITATLTTFAVDSAIFQIRSDETEIDHDNGGREIIILPFNQRIIGIAEFGHICPLSSAF